MAVSSVRGQHMVVVSGVRGEDDECDFGITQQGVLMGLLEQPSLPLGEAHLLAHPVLDLS